MEKTKKFFEDHPCLKIECLEKEAEIPTGTLRHFLKSRRELNKEHLNKLIPILKRYGYKK